MKDVVYEVTDILSKIEETSARNTKLSLLLSLSHAGQSLFKEWATLAVDPYITFGVKVETPDGMTDVGSWDEETCVRRFAQLCRNLSSRHWSGNLAKEKIDVLLCSTPYYLGKWFVRILNKSFDCGLAAKTINKAFPDHIPIFEVMLCEKFGGGELAGDFWCEPKLDGMRVVALLDTNRPAALSRNGRVVYNQEPLLEALAPEFDGWLVDYELFGGSWEESITAGKKVAGGQPATAWVFDCIPLGEFHAGGSSTPLHQRRGVLREKLKRLKLPKSRVRATPRKPVTTAEEVYAFTEQCMANGYEGAVLKDAHSPYERKRSRHWQKITTELLPGAAKEFTDDYEIVDVTVHKHGDKLGAFWCVTRDGVRFKTGSGYSAAQRKKFWAQRHDLVGSYLEVKCREFTPAGKPRFPIFQRLREDK